MTADSDFDFSAYDEVPPQTEPPEPEEELRLLETMDSDEFLVVDEPAPPPLGRAPAYDFVAHRFLPSAAGGPLMTYGTDTLRTWVEKCCRTRLGENAACHPEFGLEALFEDLLDGGPFDPAAAAQFEGVVDRALARHPRISGIEGWRVSYDDPDTDRAYASYRVVQIGEDGEPTDPLDVTIPLLIGA